MMMIIWTRLFQAAVINMLVCKSPDVPMAQHSEDNDECALAPRGVKISACSSAHLIQGPVLLLPASCCSAASPSFPVFPGFVLVPACCSFARQRFSQPQLGSTPNNKNVSFPRNLSNKEPESSFSPAPHGFYLAQRSHNQSQQFVWADWEARGDDGFGDDRELFSSAHVWNQLGSG